MKTKKILLLSDGIPPFIMGGMQKHTLNLCKYLVASGHKVELIHCATPLSQIPSNEEVNLAIFDQKVAPENFYEKCIQFPASGKLPGHYVRESKRFSQLVFEEVKERIGHFDFIYAKGFAGWQTILEKKKGTHEIPIGVKFHGYEMFQIQPEFKNKLQSKLLTGPVKENNRNADFVFSYGGKITGLIENLGIDASKIIEISGAVDADWVSPLNLTPGSGKVKFLFVGRFERRKGIEELSKTIQSLGTSIEAEFEFVGPIPEEQRLKQSNVKYYGSISDKNEIKEIYLRNEVLICPSYSEGMPNVIMEAMSQGLAVIATDVGATQLLVNEDTGWLLDNSSDDEISAKIKLAVADRVNIIKKRKAAFDLLSKNFLWDNVIEKMNHFLNSL